MYGTMGDEEEGSFTAKTNPMRYRTVRPSLRSSDLKVTYPAREISGCFGEVFSVCMLCQTDDELLNSAAVLPEKRKRKALEKRVNYANDN